MLKMQVYSERSINMHGKTTRVGEDAIPFVNQAGMFVADGMGGSAGIRIVHYDPILRDPEALTERLMGKFHMEQLPVEYRKVFTDYIRESFASLLDPAMIEFYQAPGENSIRLKKSGFFGSHALGVVMTATLLSMAEACPQTTYEKWKEFCENLKTVPFLQDYRDVIGILGTEYARASISKIDYYATTLSAALFWEKEDSVEVFLINCGDSRTYVWDADGFRQAAEDQGRNGGMTANISYENDDRVVPSFEFRTYKKPCMLFSVSDGIYATFGGRAGFHSIPMHMEGYLLNALARSASMEEAAVSLKALFDKSGHIDDSNSIAAAAFGFEDYDALKAAAARRIQTLTEMYHLDELPEDILVEDYDKRLQEMEKGAAGEIAPLLRLAYEMKMIGEYCRRKVEEPAFSGRFLADLPGLGDRQRKLRGERRLIRQNLIRAAEENFFDFVDTDLMGREYFRPLADILPIFRTAGQKAADSGRAYQAAVRERENALARALDELDRIREDLAVRADGIRFAPGSAWSREKERKTQELVDDMLTALRKAFRYAEDCLSAVQDQSAQMTRSREEWIRFNRKAMEVYSKGGGRETPESLAEKWLAAGEGLAEDLPDTTFPEVRQFILDQALLFHEKEAEEEGLEAEKDRVREKGAQDFWAEYGPHDIEIFLMIPEAFEEDPGLRDQISEMRNRDEELVRMRELARRQKKLFEDYLTEHLKEVSQDKRDDVARNGWM